MSLPKTSKFDILDWNYRAASTSDAGDSVLKDLDTPSNINLTEQTSDMFGTPFSGVVVSGASAHVHANGTGANGKTVEKTGFIVSDFDAGISETFTFEFDIRLSEHIPKDTSNLNNRVFVGALDLQGYAAGFLFSYQGLALASHPEDPSPAPLGGSANLIFPSGTPDQDTPITIRAVVDGETKRLSVYVNDTEYAYGEDPDIGNLTLRHNLAARESVDIYPDAVVVYASSESAEMSADGTAQEALFSLDSLRVSSQKLLPAEKPVASADTVPTHRAGDVVTLYSRGSYDPLGRELTYNWEVVSKPEGAKAFLSTSRHSRAYIGSTDDNNLVVLKFLSRTAEANKWSAVITDPGIPNSPLSIKTSIVDKKIKISLKTDSSAAVVTTAKSLAKAVSGNSQSEGYDIILSGGTVESVDAAGDSFLTTFEQIVSPELGANETSLGVIPAGTFQFLGGYGSRAENPSFVSDAVGTYLFSLTVSVKSSGGKTRTSDPVYCSTLVSATNQLYNHRPNTQYIWRCLSDYWNLVDGKEQITAFWSAATQVIASDLLTAWQNDYAKTIKDVGRVYQRRWLSHPTRVDFPDYVEASVFSPEETRFERLDVLAPIPVDGKNFQVTQQATSAPLSVGWGPEKYTQFLVKTSLSAPVISEVISVTETLDDPHEWLVTSKEANIPAHKTVLSRTAGRFYAEEGYVVSGVVLKSNVISDPTHRFYGLDVSSHAIRLIRKSGSTIHRILNVTEDGNVALDLSEPAIVGSEVFAWDLVELTSGTIIEQKPFFYFSSSIDHPDYTNDYSLLDEELKYGDLLTVTINTGIGERLYRLPIQAHSSKCLFVDWGEALISLSLSDVKKYTHDDIKSFSIKPLYLTRTRTLKKVEDLVSSPYLGYSTINPSDLKENSDFRVSDGSIVLYDRLYGYCKVTEGSANVEITDLSSPYPGGNPALSEEDVLKTSSGSFLLRSGDAGAYGILSVSEDGKTIVLSREVSITGTLPFSIPRFGPSRVPPEHLWSEVSYFDNHKTIQNNFGVFVGLPKEYVDAYSADLDYMSVVGAAFFAFMQGPQVGTLKSALQSVLGMPYPEVKGQIFSIKEPLPGGTGDIVVFGEGKYWHYSYPYGATISLNPETGETYEAYDKTLTSKEVPELPPAELTKYKNSLVSPYAKLVDMVTLVDYVEDPDLVNYYLEGESIIKKYHTFIIDVPLEVAKTTEVFPLIKSLATDLKPAHTNFVLVGSLRLSDAVSVVDEEFIHPTLLLGDTPHTSPFFAKKAETSAFGVPAVPATIEQGSLWPQATTFQKVQTGPNTWSHTDVKEKLESGYCEGVLDDYSGDGSWNSDKTVMDMVNTVNSDIDVVNTKMRIPVTKVTVGGYEDTEFLQNEEIDVYIEGVVHPQSIWLSSPPVLEYIASGHHPKIPFNVFSPQNEHPITYVQLSFENRPEIGHPGIPGTIDQGWDELGNYGNESRLSAVVAANNDLQAGQTLFIKGRTSGALATVDVVVDPENDAHAKYFDFSYIWETDKLIEYGPVSDPTVAITTYIPLFAGNPAANTGTSVLEFMGRSPTFDTDGWMSGAVYPNFNYSSTIPIRLSMETQRAMMDPSEPLTEQMVPSYGPGLYASWSTDAAIVNSFGLPENWLPVTWGYADVGDLDGNPKAWDSFERAGWENGVIDAESSLGLQNLHIGIITRPPKKTHFSHGYVGFFIPKPVVKHVVWNGMNGVARIEGNYFVAPDNTTTSIPTPTEFTGVKGGSWVFFKNTDTEVEYAAASVSFETGKAAALGDRTVLGIDGFYQTSTGHVLEAAAPMWDMVAGVYVVVVRNYRPYKLYHTAQLELHIDAAQSALPVTAVPAPQPDPPLGDFGDDDFGEGPFGG